MIIHNPRDIPWHDTSINNCSLIGNELTIILDIDEALQDLYKNSVEEDSILVANFFNVNTRPEEIDILIGQVKLNTSVEIMKSEFKEVNGASLAHIHIRSHNFTSKNVEYINLIFSYLGFELKTISVSRN